MSLKLLKYIISFSAIVITLCEVLNPDVGLNALQLIEQHGYPLERHGSITTEDGYILEMHRIPHGKNSNYSSRGSVLVQHGIMSSSADFVNCDNRSLAFILADSGFDVWLGNARGNGWSNGHVLYNSLMQPEKYWTFSWHEIGKFDLPAMINYILSVTKKKKLQYVGYSQGGTAFAIMGAERPEYNKKIKLATLLAPAVFMKHVTNPLLKLLSKFDGTLDIVRTTLGLYQFIPTNIFLQTLANFGCNNYSPYPELCQNIFFLILGGYDSEQLTADIIPVIVTNMPTTIATKQLMHYAQLIKSGSFHQFNYYDDLKNEIAYNQTKPPQYNLTKHSAPVQIYYGGNDLFVTEQDIYTLSSKINSVISVNKVKFDKFTHIDFLWGKDVVKLLYRKVVSVMKTY